MGQKLGIVRNFKGFIPITTSGVSTIPTNWTVFSTGSQKGWSFYNSYVGRTNELSRYQQA